jgi:hypothetical protein
MAQNNIICPPCPLTEAADKLSHRPCCCPQLGTNRQTLSIPFISFMDAAIVSTDTEVDPEGPAIVVLFRSGLPCCRIIVCVM